MVKNPFPSSVRRIAVPAPAGFPDRKRLDNSLALLHSFGIETVPGRHIFAESGESYFASSKENRAEDFNAFLHDPSIDLILCARGGYGSMQILPLIDWETLRRRNLPVVGFSDITAIHLAMLRKKAGIPIASQMAARLSAALADKRTADSMERAIGLAFHPETASFREVADLSPVGNAGDAKGKIICANLTMLTALTGTGYLPSFRNKIVILEDIGEPPRKLDRALVQLLLAETFSCASAVLFGDYTDCGTPEEHRRIFERFAAETDVPVYSGLNFGHGIPSLSFLCGEDAAIRSNTLFCRG